MGSNLVPAEDFIMETPLTITSVSVLCVYITFMREIFVINISFILLHQTILYESSFELLVTYEHIYKNTEKTIFYYIQVI